jgi:hypothetical protein
MLVAKMVNKKLVVKDHTEFFPNTIFGSNPTIDSMPEPVMQVQGWIEHDRTKQRLEPCDAYQKDGTVLVVKVVDLTAEEITAMNKVPVPQSVSPRQARLALLAAGLLDDIEEAVKSNREWQISWEYATEVSRNSPLIQAVGKDMTEEQLDQLFIDASKL